LILTAIDLIDPQTHVHRAKETLTRQTFLVS
jgi:hypothetical protein